jgi:hypothetical protein
LDQVFESIGPLPGCYQPVARDTIFKNLGPALETALKEEELPYQIGANSSACLEISPLCRDLIVTGVGFVQKVNIIFPRLITGRQFLKDRPGKS